MILNIRTVVLLLICMLIGATLLIISDQTGLTAINKQHTSPLQQLPLVEVPSRFIYLLQTESCLSEHLRSVTALGSASLCQCDVLVLSYKSPCNVTTPPHVHYVFNSSTTWGTGRNLLFEVARRRRERYLYFIFMDDDIVLKQRSNKTKSSNSWRLFESFLRRVEPAVGVVDSSHNQQLLNVYTARAKLGCRLKEKAEYYPSPRFDAAFNAFHYKAVDYILPYLHKFDHLSWLHASAYAKIKCEIIFQGHVVIHSELLAVNNKHRPYKKRATVCHEFLAVVNEIQAELPERYRCTSLLLEWKHDKVKHEHNSSTYCFPPPPPHMPIRPFNTLE